MRTTSRKETESVIISVVKALLWTLAIGVAVSWVTREDMELWKIHHNSRQQ